MSIEQLIILILFVVIPVIQALRRKLDEARAAREGSLRREPVEEREEPTPYWQEPPETPVPAPPVYVPPASLPPPLAPSAHEPRRAEPRRAEPATPRRAEPPAPRLRRELSRPAPLRRAELVPTGRDGLRRVMALTAIFGPPRALDPYER